MALHLKVVVGTSCPETLLGRQWGCVRGFEQFNHAMCVQELSMQSSARASLYDPEGVGQVKSQYKAGGSTAGLSMHSGVSLKCGLKSGGPANFHF